LGRPEAETGHEPLVPVIFLPTASDWKSDVRSRGLLDGHHEKQSSSARVLIDNFVLDSARLPV